MELTKFLPYKKMILQTSQSPDEAVNVLQAHLRSNSPFFEGSVEHYKFDIHRKLGRFERNSFIPVIKGRIDNHPQGAQIRLTIRLHIAVAALLLFISIILLRAVIGSILQHNVLPLLVVGMASIIGLVFSQIYKSEADQATIVLKRLFS